MSFKLFFEYLVRTDGNHGVGMMTSMTGLILNVVFGFIFVALLDMGTFGAAWGTFLSIAISMLIGFNYFRKHSHIRFCKPKVNWSVLVKSCTNGSNEMLTEMSTGITTLLFNLIIMRYFGEDGVAAVTIIMYIYYFFISFYMGIAVAAAPIVSYNVGSENYGKIRETTRYSFITIAVSSVLIMAVSLLFGKQIIHLFVKDGSVFTITWDGLKLFSPVFLFIGWNVFLSGYFTALGNGLISALISSPRSLIYVVAFILTLPKLIGVSGIWLTMPLSEAVTIFIAVYLYRTQGEMPNAKHSSCLIFLEAESGSFHAYKKGLRQKHDLCRRPLCDLRLQFRNNFIYALAALLDCGKQRVEFFAFSLFDLARLRQRLSALGGALLWSQLDDRLLLRAIHYADDFLSLRLRL